MPTWTALGPPGSDHPTALQSEFGHLIPFEGHNPSTAMPLDRFEAEDQNAAVNYVKSLIARGISSTRGNLGAQPDKRWHFRGGPKYLNDAGRYLGISQVLVDRSRHNPELHRVTTLLGQLCESYARSFRVGYPSLSPMDISQAKSTLEQCEQEVCKLHALAYSSQIMMDEAWRAYSFEVPNRHFSVSSDFGKPTPEPILNEAHTTIDPPAPHQATGKPRKPGV